MRARDRLAPAARARQHMRRAAASRPAPFRRTNMPVIKAADLAYGRLRSPDLDKQEEFLTAFGMVRADPTRNALYMRAPEEPHHIHVTELGEPKYVGIAFHAESLEDLEKLSRVDGATPVESLDEPGGGKRLRRPDPDGFQVKVVYGMERFRRSRSGGRR